MDKISSLVPQFYYDLIGRVVPGAFFCCAVVWKFRAELEPIYKLNPVILTSLALIAAYTAGFFLESVAAAFLDFARLRSALQFLKNRFNIPEVTLWQVKRMSLIPPSNDALLKLKGERTMIRGFCVVWILFWLPPIDLLSSLPLFVMVVGLAALALLYYRWTCYITQDSDTLEKVREQASNAVRCNQ